MLKKSIQQTLGINLIIIITLVLAIFFRFFNLDQKLYWHDEVYTSIRAAGYTGEEIYLNLFNNTLSTPNDLQKYQNIKPESSLFDTIDSLAKEDPHHPPLYFLLSRFWLKMFGSSLTAVRTLPILISLISLPLIYWLAIELFKSKLVATISTILLALSPFDILFAQINRQYALLTLTVILSSLFLVKALKQSSWKNWLFYTIACTLGFYTHIFFILTYIAQGLFISIDAIRNKKWRQTILPYIGCTVAVFLIFRPWITVLAGNFKKAHDSTSWAYRDKLEPIFLIKQWILGFTSLFIDIDLGYDNIWNYIIRVPFLILIILAVYTICKKTQWQTKLFIVTSIVIPFLLLVIPDLLMTSHRSAVTRYLISCFPAIQLAVAYFLTTKLLEGSKVGKLLFSLVLTTSVISNTINAFSDTSWSKIPSQYNAEIARTINTSYSPLLISDRGDSYTNLGDLLSLSYFLEKDTKLLLLSYPPQIDKLSPFLALSDTDIYIFRPTQKLVLALEKLQLKDNIKTISKDGSLWKIVN